MLVNLPAAPWVGLLERLALHTPMVEVRLWPWLVLATAASRFCPLVKPARAGPATQPDMTGWATNLSVGAGVRIGFGDGVNFTASSYQSQQLTSDCFSWPLESRSRCIDEVDSMQRLSLAALVKTCCVCVFVCVCVKSAGSTDCFDLQQTCNPPRPGWPTFWIPWTMTCGGC